MFITAAGIAALIIMVHLVVLIVVALVVGAGSLKAMMVVNSKLRLFMPQAQGYARLLSRKTDDVSQKAAAPFIAMDAKQARAAAMRSQATRPVSRWAKRAGLINDSTIPEE
jgi:UPF0716 family protein affecting phage T7 exclusion